MASWSPLRHVVVERSFACTRGAGLRSAGCSRTAALCWEARRFLVRRGGKSKTGREPKCPIAGARGRHAEKLPFASTFSRCRTGSRIVLAQGLDGLFHLEAREPFDVAWHISSRIDAALSASSGVAPPVLDYFRTGIVFLLHAAVKCRQVARAKYAGDGLFRCPAGCRDIDGRHIS